MCENKCHSASVQIQTRSIALVIQCAKAELEAEAKAKAAAEQPARAKVDEKPPRKPPPAAAPEPKAQRNFTDPESLILKTKDGYIQGYNAQAAVDAHAQIIVAHTLGNNGSDQNQFVLTRFTVQSLD